MFAANPVEAKRQASTFEEARSEAQSFQGKILVNNRTGIPARVSGNSLDKLLSGRAIGKSSSPRLQSEAVANVDAIFEWSMLGWDKPDTQDERNLGRLYRFFAPFRTLGGQLLMTKVTVKEVINPKDENKLYLIEAVDLSEASSAAQWVAEALRSDRPGAGTIRSAEAVLKVAQAVGEFNASAGAKERRGASFVRDLPRTAKAWRKDRTGFWADLLTDAMGGQGGSLLALVPLRPLLTEIGKPLAAARAYLRTKEKMDALRQEEQATAARVSDAWQRLNRKGRPENAALMDIMHRATAADIDRSKPVDAAPYDEARTILRTRKR